VDSARFQYAVFLLNKNIEQVRGGRREGGGEEGGGRREEGGGRREEEGGRKEGTHSTREDWSARFQYAVFLLNKNIERYGEGGRREEGEGEGGKLEV
jgi:hypothetical protein